MSNQKQAIVLRTDIKMSKGKMIAQACHASLGAYRKADEEQQDSWEDAGEKKVMLESGDEGLEGLFNQAKQNNLPVHLVKDAGRTELEPGTVTAVGIGPAEEQKIDKITGQLGLIE